MNASKATQDQSIAEGRLKPQGQTRLRSHEKQLSLGVESPGVESPNITTQPCTVTGPRVISRDEMNLAEFPLAVLSTRSNPNIKTLEFSDSIRGKRGELINRKWIITGADKFGLPTSSDDEVLLGLMKLTVDKGFESRKIHFTRYELLKALQWSTEGRSSVSYTHLRAHET